MMLLALTAAPVHARSPLPPVLRVSYHSNTRAQASLVLRAEPPQLHAPAIARASCGVNLSLFYVQN
jgi:hypothetical protein